MDTIAPAEDNYTRIYKSFVERYKDAPGIIYIQDDDWFGDYIFVGVDKEIVESLPEKFEGLCLQVIDVYGITEAIEMQIDILKLDQKNLSSEEDTLLSFFKDQHALLRQKLDEYENK